jgi:uncharacterized membrane protein YbhN (UPF0104 family)
LPWVVAIGIFAYILSSTDLEALRSSAASARWMQFWCVSFGLYAVIFATDSFTVWWMYRRFHVPQIRYRDVLPARGASYFLGILNYAAGSAAMAFYFKKRFRVGFLEGGASLLLLMLVDLGLVTLAVLIGGSMLPAEWTGATVATIGGFALTWNLVIRCLAGAFVAAAVAHIVFWRAPWSWGPLERIREIPTFAGFRRATVLDYLKIGVIRTPVTILYILMHGLTLTAFHIHVPWAQMMVFVPIQMLIAVIPISPSGLGTVNLAQRLLYEPYVHDVGGEQLVAQAATASIDAYGLALALAFNVPRLVIGFVALRAAKRALQNVAQSSQETP